jgi:hypothetical protein
MLPTKSRAQWAFLKRVVDCYLEKTKERKKRNVREWRYCESHKTITFGFAIDSAVSQNAR